MDKQRMSNILSSIQMNPRDRKDFIDELSKLGTGGNNEENNEENDGILSYTLKFSYKYISNPNPTGYIAAVNNEGIDFNKEEEKVKLYIEIENECKTVEPIIVTAKRLQSNYGATANKYYLDINIEPTTLKAIFYNNNNIEGVINIGIKSGVFAEILGHGYAFTTYETIEYPKYNKEYPVFIRKTNDTNDNQNKQILESIDITQCYLFNSDNKLYLSFYNNGTIITFIDNKLKQFEINSETGYMTESLSIDISTLAGLEARIAALEGA